MRPDVTGVTLSVVDPGRGVPADKLETIFGRFQQVDASDSRLKGGTGLGLAICRTIVHQHSGRIWAERNPLRGSSFRVFLPYKPVPIGSADHLFDEEVVDVLRDADSAPLEFELPRIQRELVN
jgi:signal transduction histidine kinase